MFAVNQDKADESLGRTLKDFRGAVLVQLAVLNDRPGVCKIFHWLWDEARRSAMMRELNLLDDQCLDDLGLRRPFDQRTDDLVKRLRVGG